MSGKTGNVWARVALFAAALIWGSSFFIIKGAVDFLPPATLMAVRFSMGAIALAALFPGKIRMLNAQQWKRGLIIGLILGIASLVQNLGIQYTTPGKSAFLTAVYCVITPFMFWVVRKNRPPLRRFIAAFLCLIGIGLVSLNESLSIGRGDLLTLVCGFLFAAHIVSVETLGYDMDPVSMSMVQFLGGAILCWVYAFIFEGNPCSHDWSVWPQVLYLGLASTTLAFLLQVIGQKTVSPSETSLIVSLESVFGVLFSCLFYGEVLTPRLILGFSVIFVSVLISEINFNTANKE